METNLNDYEVNYRHVRDKHNFFWKQFEPMEFIIVLTSLALFFLLLLVFFWRKGLKQIRGNTRCILLSYTFLMLIQPVVLFM